MLESSVEGSIGPIIASLAAGPYESFFLDAMAAAAPSPQRYSMELTEIAFDRKLFELRVPIQVILSYEEDVWSCEANEFSILSFGETPEMAARSFCEDFSVMWDVIAQASDEELTTSAGRVKASFLGIVRLVGVR